ncbi:hypothetical protein LH51_02440, partial [Nitrincola sp. A-D6]
TACQGGSFAVESVAAFAWNGWQASSGISGNLGLEYAQIPKTLDNAVDSAAALYMDIINLFLRILRILGRK